jgi:hypothetical protein
MENICIEQSNRERTRLNKPIPTRQHLNIIQFLDCAIRMQLRQSILTSEEIIKKIGETVGQSGNRKSSRKTLYVKPERLIHKS